MSGRHNIRMFQGTYASGLAALCLLGVFLAVCLVLLPPRFFFQQGVRQFRMKDYTRAIAFFEQAHTTIPSFLSRTPLTAADRFRLNARHGRALYLSAKNIWKAEGPTPEAYTLFMRSRENLARAAAIENRDYLTSYWRARTEHALERIHPWLHPDTPNPYDADDLYLHAVSLRPAGITVRQAYARYLYETGRAGRIPILVSNLMEIYPPIYKSLRKEAYYTPALLPYMKQGLKNAVRKGIRPRDALNRLALVYQEQNRLGPAIDTFETYLAYDPEFNTQNDFFFLATLCMQDGRHEKSLAAFSRSIAVADDREAALRRIYRYFRSLNQLTRFLAFIQRLEDDHAGVPGLDMVKVQTYLDLDQVFLARELLDRILAYKPTGESLYLRATIARKEKDWDAMELFSQRATRLAPENHGYHYLFSLALNYQKKYASAEEAVTRAILLASGDNAGYYNFRAWNRWYQEKYQEAAQDWDKAAALNPDNPDFPDRAARAREKAGLGPVITN